MKYAKVINGIVEQVQPNSQSGFVEVADDIVCGMVTTDNINFSNPLPAQAEIEAKFRADRDTILNTTVDYYQKVLVYNSLTATQQTELATYRQELLDATLTWTMPTAPTWIV